MNRYMMTRRLRGPIFLMLVGVLALLNQAGVLSWGKSWPFFLIVAGVLVLVERAVLVSALQSAQREPFVGGNAAVPNFVAYEAAAPHADAAGSGTEDAARLLPVENPPSTDLLESGKKSEGGQS